MLLIALPYTLSLLSFTLAHEPICVLKPHQHVLSHVHSYTSTPVKPTPPSTPPATPSPTPSNGISQSKIDRARTNMKEIAHAPWEVGVAAEALTELLAPRLSVFDQGAFPPPAILNATYDVKDVVQYATFVVNSKSPGSMTLSRDNGSAADPASIGVAVLLANWTRPDKTDHRFADAAGLQLSYLLNVAPRTDSGAISHRSEFPAMWSDFVYMVPPFIAYFAVLDNGGGGLNLLREAYNQCRLYREALFNARDRGGLWQHVLIGPFQDNNHWATGNAWAAAGMLRVRETIRHSTQAPQLAREQADLTNWIREILDAVVPLQRPSGLVLNTLDAQPYDTFEDSSATALFAAVAYRMAKIDNAKEYLPFADQALTAINNNLGDDGWLRNTVDPLSFYQPGGQSPEGQAFVLLMQAAHVAYLGT